MPKPDPKKTICIFSVSDKQRTELADNISLLGYTVVTAKTQPEVFGLFEKSPSNICIVDLENMPGQELDMVNYIKSSSTSTEIIILAPINQLETATQTLRNGASFYLIKPIEFADIKVVLDKLAMKLDRQSEHVELEQKVLSDLMVGSPAMQKLLKLSVKIAPTTSAVLIGGESGTGKEFFARIIHRMSNRYAEHFVAVNCGAVPDTLFESELFGHKKGSFTGADRDRVGLVEEANLGTLFLDEVGELTPSAQVKLLRFLQEKSFRRIGENAQRTVNVRVIAASNKDLEQLIKEGKFREDLFYRLNVFYLHVPPLRERKETIPNLVRLFVHRNNQVLGRQVNRISKAAEIALMEYSYPGNVRELENIIEHAMVLSAGDEIKEDDLPVFMLHSRLMLPGPAPGPCYGQSQEILTLEELEKLHIVNALHRLNFNFSETAEKLGVSRSTLWRKIKIYSIETPDKLLAEDIQSGPVANLQSTPPQSPAGGVISN